MNAVRLEPLEPAGIPAMIELARKIWYAHYPGIITHAQIEFMLARMYAPETIQAELSQGLIRWILIYSGETLTGFASYGPLNSKQLKLHKLYVDPAFHGQGLGRAALKQVVHTAQELDCEEICLNVNKQNEKAISAYRKFGFTVARELVVDIGGGFVMDDFLMVYELRAP